MSETTDDAPGGESANVEAREPDMSAPAWRRLTEGENRWAATVAILVMIALQVRLPDGMSPGGPWLLPAVELSLLIVLVAANPHRISHRSPLLRWLGLALIVVASLFNAWALVRLVHQLFTHEMSDAGTLLTTGANIWVSNIIIFALWYWELDRGGPASRALGEDLDPDFLFPQMAETSIDFHHWEPEFVDYFYVSFTNAAAFSPTDTMPLTRWAKLAMTVQSAVSLATAILVIARAINVL